MLAGCLKNNAAAQEALYSRFSPRMLGVCYRFAKNREDAEDMLQEGFIKVFTQMHQYRNEGALEGWIRRIIVHTCINHLKKNKKFSESLDIIHANSMHINEEMIPSIMQAKQVVECIRTVLYPKGNILIHSTTCFACIIEGIISSFTCTLCACIISKLSENFLFFLRLLIQV